ncbi:MAG: glycosyl hydrolase family 79 C-terminal domain-containing protein [Granulicella sp.]
MNRRSFLATTTLTAAHLATRHSFAAQPADTIQVLIDPTPATPPIPADFLGLGYEISSVTQHNLLTPTNSVYLQLVRTLGAQGVLRIGGNTADYASYAPNATPLSLPKGTVVNEETLRNLGGFLKATNWKLIWALNLGQNDLANAIAEAKAITAIAGPHLLAFEIGNEPDLFPNEKHRPSLYTYAQWLADYRRYKSALRAALPHIPFAGPDAASKTDWVTSFAADEGHDAVLLTHHYYRGGQRNPTSTIPTLLGPDPKLQPQLDQLRAASQTSGLPYRICEVNSFSGGGRPGVSDTFAAALWVLDYMFTLARNGCSGVNMETGVNQLGFISPYSPIFDDTHSHYTARPEYYGMLAFSLAAKGRILPTTLSTALPDIKLYATQPTATKLTLTAINKGPHDQTLTIPIPTQLPARHATILRLTAPSLDVTTNITLGGAQVSPDGTWKPLHAEPLSVTRRTLQLTIPATSAAIVRIT